MRAVEFACFSEKLQDVQGLSGEMLLKRWSEMVDLPPLRVRFDNGQLVTYRRKNNSNG